MSGKSEDGWHYGKLVGLAHQLPPVEVDCPCWESDIPAEQWTADKLVSLAQSLPPVVIDCSDW